MNDSATATTPTPADRSSKPSTYPLLVALALALFGAWGPAAKVVAQPHPYAAAQPLEAPRVFAPGVISTDAIEYGVTFAPDGQTVYFTRRASWRDAPAIYASRFAQGAWQEPQVASFSGTHGDEYPFLTHDGSRLYFASKRPATGTAAQDHNDLWYVERTTGGWGTPQRLEAPLTLAQSTASRSWRGMGRSTSTRTGPAAGGA